MERLWEKAFPLQSVRDTKSASEGCGGGTIKPSEYKQKCQSYGNTQNVRNMKTFVCGNFTTQIDRHSGEAEGRIYCA